MPTPTPAELHQLRRFTLHHCALLPQLQAFLGDINPELREEPEARFLCLVRRYDMMSRGAIKMWEGLYTDFTRLFDAVNQDEATDSVLRFFLVSYMFLTKWNDDSHRKQRSPILLGHMKRRALDICSEVSEPLNDLCWGFLLFNMARWQHGCGKYEAAKQSFVDAAQARIHWYLHAEHVREEFVIVAAAAEQVRELPGAFTKLFPEEDVTQLRLNDELMQDILKIAPDDREVT